MRQVFTSLRIETVEGVARLLEEAGIETYIANGRSYHSKRGSQFSYAEPMKAKQQPSVWVQRAEDQPRARELLRAAGLLASTRPGQGDPLVFATPLEDESGKRRSWAWRIRVALMIGVALVAVFTVMRHRNVQETLPPTEEETIRIRIPNPPAQP